nr:reverse transcriptase domain-containing protein [Tanacetum cinerariifolium]
MSVIPPVATLLFLVQPTRPTIKVEVERKPEVTRDKVQTTSLESNAHVHPLVVQVPISDPNVALKPNPKPSILYPSRLNDQKLREKTNSQMLKFLQIFQRLYFELSFADALPHIPNFTSTFKRLLSNKEKLFELANTPLTENFSVVLLRKLPEKLRNPRRFLIPCDFYGLESCMALADLGTRIILMPLSIWKKLSLPNLTPTRMTLELGARSIAYPARIAEDVFVQAGKFTFLADFIVVNYEVNHCVPFILGRPFLRIACALVDEFADELALLDPFLPRNKGENFDLEADLRKNKYLLNQNPLTESNVEIIDPILKNFTDEPALNYLPPPGDDDDDLFDLKSDNDEWKKLFDSTLPEESSEIFTLSLSPFINEDKVFNPGIQILGRTQILKDESKDKDLILRDHNFLSISSDHELLFFLKLTVIKTLLSFSSENEDKIFNLGILVSKGVHSFTLR